MSARHPGCRSLGRSAGVTDAQGRAFCIDCNSYFVPMLPGEDEELAHILDALRYLHEKYPHAPGYGEAIALLEPLLNTSEETR